MGTLDLDDEPWLGLAGVDAIIGLNSMVGVGGPIKCVQIIKILKANVIFQIFNVILSDTIFGVIIIKNLYN